MDNFIHIVYDKILGILVSFIGTVMVCAVLIQVAARYLPVVGFNWTEELARLTFVWFCFLATAYTLSKKMHLGIDYFYLKMSKKVQHFLDILAFAVVFAFGTILTYYGIFLLGIVSIQKSPVLQLSLSYFYAAVPVAGILFVVFSGLSIVKLCLKQKEKPSIIQN